MTLSPDIIATVFLALFGFVFGALWGHHGAIQNRVKFSDCSEKREKCPCVEAIRDIRRKMEDNEK